MQKIVFTCEMFGSIDKRPSGQAAEVQKNERSSFGAPGSLCALSAYGEWKNKYYPTGLLTLANKVLNFSKAIRKLKRQAFRPGRASKSLQGRASKAIFQSRFFAVDLLTERSGQQTLKQQNTV